MTLGKLIFREIRRDRLGFVAGLFAVTAAAAVVTAELTILKAHDVMTASILTAKETEIAASMARMEDDYRKIMKELGFNLLILPENQRLDNFYDEGYASRYMPEDNVKKLAASDIVTIQHLLPSLESKVRWPEQANRTILLMGTRGEVPSLKSNGKEPMLVAVPPGEIVLGFELWNSLGLKRGDTVKLLGRSFTVGDCYKQRGTKDDITAWIDLATAQNMLDKPGMINGILALKCLCENNEIENVRKDVARFLPGVQVIEMDSKVAIRAQARERAKITADSTLAAEKLYRARLRGEQESFAGWVVPLVIVGGAALVGFLAFVNVRNRRQEIGILRALGFRSGQILYVFLGKAVILGFAGAVAGWAAGFVIAVFTAVTPSGTNPFSTLLSPSLVAMLFLSSPLLSSLVSWVPALSAAREDPADILSEE